MLKEVGKAQVIDVIDRRHSTPSSVSRREEWSLDEVMLPGLPDVGRLFCF